MERDEVVEYKERIDSDDDEYDEVSTVDVHISILYLSCRTMTYNFHSSCKHMHLSFKSVCNREHKGVICNMTYKDRYITAKMIFTQSVSELHPIY